MIKYTYVGNNLIYTKENVMLISYRTRLVLWGIGIVSLFLLSVVLSHAQLPSTVDEPSIAGTYNQIAGVSGWGLLGAVPFEAGRFHGHASAVAQSSSTLLRSKGHAEIGTSLSNWDFYLYTNWLIKKYTGAEPGRVSGLGFAVEAPKQKIGVFNVTAGLGIEGQNGGQIGAPNAGDTLESFGYDPEVLEEKDLYRLNPAPTGLTLQQGNTFKGVIYAELAHPSGLSITLKGLPEITGESEHPIHQLIISGNTSFELGEQVSLEVGADIGLQTYQETIERELATLVAVKLSF